MPKQFKKSTGIDSTFEHTRHWEGNKGGPHLQVGFRDANTLPACCHTNLPRLFIHNLEQIPCCLSLASIQPRLDFSLPDLHLPTQLFLAVLPLASAGVHQAI